jgi:hypothetical protein
MDLHWAWHIDRAGRYVVTPFGRPKPQQCIYGSEDGHVEDPPEQLRC